MEVGTTKENKEEKWEKLGENGMARVKSKGKREVNDRVKV